VNLIRLLSTLGETDNPLPPGMSNLLPVPILISSAEAVLARTSDESLRTGLQAVKRVIDQLAIVAALDE
jgi:hypothetical protein